MPNDMQELRIDSVNLILGPKGISVDKSGRIVFSQPEILQALVAARPVGAVANDNTNYANCNANNYQCGKGSVA